MMEPVLRINGYNANPNEGEVVVDWPKAVWNLGMLLASVILIPFYTTPGSILLFVVLTYFTLLIGHSAGMHRMMIHRSFKAIKPVERLLIYIGVLVGMSGPYGVIKIHDLRDWAQRQAKCHDFFSHRRSYWKDLWWQLTSSFKFTHPPRIQIEDNLYQDPFYQFLEKTWRLHQIPLAFILYYIGGLPFVVWGIFVRVSISVVGHWTITYFCHNPGQGRWKVKGAYVQASNLPGLGILTYGECWHNNHHAFPESARIGIEKGQSDPTWHFIQLLRAFGWIIEVKLSRSQDSREDLQEITNNKNL